MELLIPFISLIPYIIIGVLIPIDIVRLLKKRRKKKPIEAVVKELDAREPLDASKIDRTMLRKWERGNYDTRLICDDSSLRAVNPQERRTNEEKRHEIKPVLD